MHNIEVGMRIKFAGEKCSYAVMAYDGRYAICTKPFSPHNTVLYTIVDFEGKIRSTNNLIFNDYDYAMQPDIDRCLVDLQSGATGISSRNEVALVIDKIIPVRTTKKQNDW